MYNKITFVALTLVFLVGCQKPTPTFSFLPTQNTFKQNESTVNNKIDILWVIDNSGSMNGAQQDLKANFDSFIQDFVTKGYDYKIAVTTTDAWRSSASGVVDGDGDLYYSNDDRAVFKDHGFTYDNPSSPNCWEENRVDTGVSIITPDTPYIEDTFKTNAIQGVCGNGDERAFQSFKAALSTNLNAGFLREDSFLSIIIVSDEDDFSHDENGFAGYYSYPGLHTVESYNSYLENLTGTSGASKRFSVSAMAIWDQQCVDQQKAVYNSTQLIAQRYGALVDLTEGIKGSLCGNFAQSLLDISNNIIQLSTQFFLEREPDVSTIEISINGVNVPLLSENQSGNGGYEYNAESNSIKFYGDYIPEQGATIVVDYDPVSFAE